MVETSPVQPQVAVAEEAPLSPKEEFKSFWSKFSQGGPYFKYLVMVLVILVLAFLGLATAAILPYLTGGKYQNAISERVNEAFLLPVIPMPEVSTPTPKPTPIPLKPDNGLKGTYIISQGKHDGPTFKQVVFDPLDVSQGQALTITVTLDAASRAEKMMGKLIMDNGDTSMTFERISENATPQVWQTKLNLNDSVLYNYILEVSASLNGRSSQIIVAPRS